MALRMKDGTKWVDVPENMLPKLPSNGIPAQYNFTDKFPDYKEGGIKRELFKNEVELPPIFDAQIGSKMVTLGIVGNFDQQGNPDAAQVRRLSFRPQELGGKLYLNPIDKEGVINADDQELFYALQLHPMVEDNDNKITRTPVMRSVDTEAEAKQNREARNLRREAMGRAATLKGDELERAALLLGHSNYNSNDELLDALEKDAENNPKHFVDVLEDKNGDIIANFRKGLQLGEIMIDPTASQIKWKNKNQLLQVANPSDIDSVTKGYVDYANTDSGKKVNDQLKSMIAMNEKQAGKAKKAGTGAAE